MNASAVTSKDYVLSVIIPFLNESASIEKLLLNIDEVFPEIEFVRGRRKLAYEFIFVDGGSIDETPKKINKHFQNKSNVFILESEKGRAKQMNIGALKANGDAYLFIHADTLLPNTACHVLMDFFEQNKKVWGSFSISFDDNAIPFRLLSWMINRRSELTQVVTGDQALFVKRDNFEKLGGFPDIPLMEDVAITKKLRKYSSGFRCKDAVITSSRRWKHKGLLRTIMLMWFLRLAYVLGVSPKRLASWYYPDA